MANRTVKDAQSIHGTNPQYLVEKIIRTRIYDSKYWKESCFALTAELLVDKAMDLKSIGGVYGGNIKPTPFICLTLKMLQIQPEKDIIIEFIKQDDFKYVRALGAFYLRLVHSSEDCYKYLEPLLNDYRKLRSMNRNGLYELTHIDEFIDILMREERVCDIMLPRIQKRWVHEANNELEARVSLLDDDLEDLESDSDQEDNPPSPPPPRSNAENRISSRDERPRSPLRNENRIERSKRHRSRSRDLERTKRHEGKRRKSRSREKRHKSPSSRHHRHRDGEKKHHHESSSKRREHRRERREKGGEEYERERRKHHHKRDRGGYDVDIDPDIAEANALRAKLGMAPLR